MALTIWSNCRLSDRALDLLRAGVGDHRLIRSEVIVNNLVAGQPDPLLVDADIAFGQPDTGQIMELSRLKFVQLSSAGYARYDRADVRDALKRRGAMLCNSSAVFSEPCAQHVLAYLLAGARQLPTAMTDQLGAKTWRDRIIRSTSSLLNGQTILIIGFGSIGRRLAELIAPLHMKAIAVRRHARGDEPIPVRAMAELDQLLPEADHIVNILPASGDTDRVFDAARFARMKPGAIFYNIGRGATVDQLALAATLTAGHLAAAFLDVTVPEPLPANDPLWTTPNCYITPHTAGGAKDEFDRAVEHFLENLSRFSSGKPLLDRVV
jgi:phosphoglycerate dehydrogenase-like enzyme